jgi:membrane associated rhomboid family serine protease
VQQRSALEPAGRRSSREEGLALVGLMIAVMWVVEIIDTTMNNRLDQYGIEPRETDGLIGIVAAPFLHDGFGHLISNTLPFVVMGIVIALNGAARVIAVTVIVALVAGIGTWVIGPEYTNHIGASGIVFGYGSYLITRGFFNKSALDLAVGLVIAAVFGTALLSGLAPQDGISWQGHLFGAIGGIIAARVLAGPRDQPARHRGGSADATLQRSF